MVVPVTFIHRAVKDGGYEPIDRKRVLPTITVPIMKFREIARTIGAQVIQMGEWDVAVDRITDLEVAKTKRIEGVL